MQWCMTSQKCLFLGWVCQSIPSMPSSSRNCCHTSLTEGRAPPPSPGPGRVQQAAKYCPQHLHTYLFLSHVLIVNLLSSVERTEVNLPLLVHRAVVRSQAPLVSGRASYHPRVCFWQIYMHMLILVEVSFCGTSLRIGAYSGPAAVFLTSPHFSWCPDLSPGISFTHQAGRGTHRCTFQVEQYYL